METPKQTKQRGRKLKKVIDLSQLYPLNENDNDLTRKRKELVQGYVKDTKSKQDKISVRAFEKMMKEEGKSIILPSQFSQLDSLIDLGFKVAYITNEKPAKARYGGYLKAKHLDEGYIVLKGLFGISFSVQLDNVKKFFVSDPKDQPKKKTIHSLYINDNLEKEFKKVSDAKRFMQTKKFLDANVNNKVELRKTQITVPVSVS